MGEKDGWMLEQIKTGQIQSKILKRGEKEG